MVTEAREQSYGVLGRPFDGIANSSLAGSIVAHVRGLGGALVLDFWRPLFTTRVLRLPTAFQCDLQATLMDQISNFSTAIACRGIVGRAPAFVAISRS